MKKWKPKGGEMYYFINLCRFGGSVCLDQSDDNCFEEIMFRHYNCFRTKKEATIMLRKIKQLLRKGA